MPRWACAFVYKTCVGETAHGDGSRAGTLFARRGQISSHRASRCSLLRGPEHLDALRAQEVFREKWAPGVFQFPGIVVLPLG